VRPRYKTTMVVMMPLDCNIMNIENNNSSPIIHRSIFYVELLSRYNLINKIDNGKAAGLDDLTSEHASEVYYCIIVTKLFNLFI